MQKRIFISTIIIALIATVTTASLWGNIDNNKKSEINHIEELYSMKNTAITDKVEVHRVVKFVNTTEYEIVGVDIWKDAGDERVDVKFKVDDRSNYRYVDYTAINKTAMLVLALIPDADAIAFYMFDEYGDENNLETSFNGSYFDRNFVYDRKGMDKFNIEYIDGACESIDAFKEYYSAVMNIVGKDTKSDWLDQMYAFIGDDCEIVVNSGMGVDIALDDDFLSSDDCNIIEKVLNVDGTGVKFSSYPGKGESIHIAKYDIRNFKTGVIRKCAVAYCYHTESGLMMLAQKFLDEPEDIQIFRNQITKR